MALYKFFIIIIMIIIIINIIIIISQRLATCHVTRQRCSVAPNYNNNYNYFCYSNATMRSNALQWVLLPTQP